MSLAPGLRRLAGLDESQLAAVLARDNCIVTAGAGAGKTSVLVARCLDLVLGRKIPIRSVLALTFTKKAAAEMYERIYRGLQAEDSDWAGDQLADFGNARITTLDSFCSEITRSAAGTWGYTADYTIDEDRTAELAATIARDYVTGNRRRPGLAALLRSFPLDAVCEDLFAALGSKMVSPLRLLEPLFRPMGPALETEADRLAAGILGDLAGLCRGMIETGSENPEPKADCRAAIEASRLLLRACGDRSPSIHELAAIEAELSGIGSLGLRSYGRSVEETAVKELAKAAREEARKLLGLAAFHTALPSQIELLERLDEYALELAEAKRLADLMDYKDLGLCAVRALESQPDLRAAWKRRFEAILIDEFQDNNSLQKRLLFLLAERTDRFSPGVPGSGDLQEGKLFLVGDEKQSIYKFRGADVSVFKTISAELAEGAKVGAETAHPLAFNYRSTPALVRFFNGLFSRTMNADEGPSKPDFSASYADMKSGLPDLASFPSRIRSFRLEAGDEEEDDAVRGDLLEPDDALAFSVARFIRDSVGVLSTRRGPAAYEDFAVLLKTTTNQHRLERYFRLLGIPFGTESPKGLFRESPVNDLYAALSLILDHEDRAAYAAVLRGPLCRISDQGFLALMTGGAGPFEAAGALSTEDAEALDAAGAFFALAEAKAAGSSVSEVLDFLWREGGIRASILTLPSAHPFLEHFDYLFRLAASVDARGGDLAGFRALLRPGIEGRDEGLELENLPRPPGEGVKLLTVHKAKGLQFPIVVLPWIENSLALRRENTLWYPFEGGIAVDERPFDAPGAKASNVLFQLAKDLEKAKSEAELKRLFYVACTRAEDHLFFFGKTPKRGGGEASSFSSLLDAYAASGGGLEESLLAPVTRKEPLAGIALGPEPDARAFADAYAGRPVFAAAWPRIRFQATELGRAAAGGGAAGAVGGPGTAAPATGRPEAEVEAVPLGSIRGAGSDGLEPGKFGELCHAAVEHAVRTGSTEGFLAPSALLEGLSAGPAGAALDQALAFAKTFLEGTLWKELSRQGGPELEKAFLLAAGGLLVDGRMDFYLETEGAVTVLDFKSDSVADPAPHALQLAIYRRAASEIAGAKPVRAGIWWLRTGRISWMDAELDETELARAAEAARSQQGSTGSE